MTEPVVGHERTYGQPWKASPRFLPTSWAESSARYRRALEAVHEAAKNTIVALDFYRFDIAYKEQFDNAQAELRRATKAVEELRREALQGREPNR